MKRLILLLCGLIILLGCSNTETDELEYYNKHVALKVEHVALQNKYAKLQADYEAMQGIKDERDKYHNDYNSLVRQNNELQTKYTILEAQYKAISNQYNTLASGFSGRETTSNEALAEINKQYQLSLARIEDIEKHIRMVDEKKVTVLSENLTASEYTAFYKGWYLWWASFN